MSTLSIVAQYHEIFPVSASPFDFLRAIISCMVAIDGTGFSDCDDLMTQLISISVNSLRSLVESSPEDVDEWAIVRLASEAMRCVAASTDSRPSRFSESTSDLFRSHIKRIHEDEISQEEIFHIVNMISRY